MLFCHLRHLAAGGAELAGVELVVEALLGQQFLMGAALDDFAVIDDQNLVGIPNRAQTAGDNEAGTASGNALNFVSLAYAIILQVQSAPVFIPNRSHLAEPSTILSSCNDLADPYELAK